MAYTREDKFIKALGRKIRAIRESQSISIESLAHKAGLSYSQLARIERGEVNTSISHIAVISKALNVPAKNLFDF